MFRSISLLTALALSLAWTLAAAPNFGADLAAAQSDAVALRTSADNLLMLARHAHEALLRSARQRARTRSRVG